MTRSLHSAPYGDMRGIAQAGRAALCYLCGCVCCRADGEVDACYAACYDAVDGFLAAEADWVSERCFGIGLKEAAGPVATEIPKERVSKLLLEKIPLLAMSAAVGVATVLAQKSGGAVKSLHLFPMGVRLANASVAAILYVWKMVWPVNLAFFYPHPGRTIPVVGVIGSVLALGVLTAAAIYWRRKRPYIAVGWLWILITVLPVLGIVQVGGQAMADRYSYIPYVGLFAAVIWGAYDLLAGLKIPMAAGAVAGMIVIGLLATGARQQVDYRHERLHAVQSGARRNQGQHRGTLYSGGAAGGGRAAR